MYHVVFTGGTIEAGDYVIFVRNDWRSGNTGCEGVVDQTNGPKLLDSGMHNDYVYCDGTNAADCDGTDSNAQDHGGLVRSANLDGEAGDEVFSDVELLGADVSLGQQDGRTDPTMFDDDDSDITGSIEDHATYTLCLADYSANSRNGVPYTFADKPTSESEFTHYAHIMIHIVHGENPLPARAM